MYIKDIKIVNFRNYDRLSLTFEKGINIIYGNNGQGKTNLLESLFVLAMTKSHRSYIDTNLIKNGKTNLKITGNIYIHKIKTKMEIIIDQKDKILKIDNQAIQKSNNYISKMNIIIFYPDDLDLIKGSPNIRRRYLNLEISQLDSQYITVLNDYSKLLKMRNDYLKKESFNQTYFDILTNYLIDKSVIIYKMRKKFVDKLNENAEKIFFNLTGISNFKIQYRPSVLTNSFEKDQLKKSLEEQFQKNRKKELKYKITLLGPHRDDLEFYMGDKNMKCYGSQGQQRMSILSLKLAEIEIFKKYSNEYPILLLDDVFSELDKKKKNCLLKYLSDDLQTIITTTDLNQIQKKILKKSKLIEIENGIIRKITEVN